MIGLWIARTLSVSLIVEAWWQCVCSVLRVNIDQKLLLGLVFLSSAFCNGMFAGSGKKNFRIMAAAGAAVLIGAGIVWKSDIFIGTLNHIVNAYLKLGVSQDVTIHLYHEMGATLLQRTLAAAVFLLPLTVVFTAVQRYGKGKLAAGILLILPVLLPTLKVHFPDNTACWLMVAASAVYFSMVGVSGSRAAWNRGIVSIAAAFLLILVSSAAGGKIDVRRKAENSSYYRIRAAVQENIADPAEGWLKKKQEKTEEKEVKEEEKKTGNEKADEQSGEDRNIIQMLPEGTFPGESKAVFGDELPLNEGTLNLGEITRFSPNGAGDITITLNEKPEGTVYQPLWYGGSYKDNSWEKLSANDDIYNSYSEQPQGADRLTDYCRQNPCPALEDVEKFIDEEFMDKLVYDYEPGAVPEGHDFAEYFFFDNRKGFCVHFATTAALIYRIYGFPARYAQGYAIPAQAFTKQEDGSYTAQVTGDMGHAWCEVYDGGWVIKEHTLPYTGQEREEKGPASYTEKTIPADYPLKLLAGGIAAAALTAIAAAAFFLQAAVRRGRRRASYMNNSREKALKSMFQNIYDTAVFLGMEKGDPLYDSTIEEMSHYCIGLDREELWWLKEKVQESLFYDRIPAKEDYKRAYDMHEQFAAETVKELTGFQKLKYRYLLCLG